MGLNLVAKEMDLENSSFDSDADDVDTAMHPNVGSLNPERNRRLEVERGG